MSREYNRSIRGARARPIDILVDQLHLGCCRPQGYQVVPKNGKSGGMFFQRPKAMPRLAKVLSQRFDSQIVLG